MAQKKSRQTFEKLKREQAVKERRAKKQERRVAVRLARRGGVSDPVEADGVVHGAFPERATAEDE
jgi:hypothetical protein